MRQKSTPKCCPDCGTQLSDPRKNRCLPCANRVRNQHRVKYPRPTEPPNPTGLCQCGCGGKTERAKYSNHQRGHLAGEYRRFIFGHHARKQFEREWIEVDCGFTSPCWVWQGLMTGKGYGKIMPQGQHRYVPAHRYTFERHKGEIPDGLDLDHLCRNRACVNPDHLEPVTTAVNNQRGAMTKITPDQVREIRRLKGTMRQKDIGAMFGIGQAQVSVIHRGEAWKNVAGR